MRKFWVLGVLALVALSLAAPVWAADDDDSKWHVHGGVRVRGDYFENYDFTDRTSATVPDDNFGIWPFMARVSIDGELSDSIHGMVEFRNDSTLGSSPTLSSDPRLYSNSPNAESDVQIYQAFIDFTKMGGSNMSLRIGRQEHTLGTELLIGDNDFYTGQAFDGFRFMWNTDRWDVNLFYYKILELNSNPTFNTNTPSFNFATGSSDSNFMGATFDWKFDPKWGQIDVYYLRAQDLSGNFANFDPGITTTTSTLGAAVDTYGARWGKTVAHDSKDMFDWNVEYAKQSGSYGFFDLTTPGPDDAEVDLSGDIAEGWFGFNFHTGNAHHRVHVGFLQSSGDDSNTTDDEAFVPLFGDNHAHNRLGNLDNFGLEGVGLSGIQDINVGYDLWFGEDQKHWFMLAFHQIKLDQEVVTNLAPLTTKDDYGTIWDFNYGYMMSKNVSFEVGASQHMGGDVQDAQVAAITPPFNPPATSSDNAMRLYGQVSLRW